MVISLTVSKVSSFATIILFVANTVSAFQPVSLVTAETSRNFQLDVASVPSDFHMSGAASVQDINPSNWIAAVNQVMVLGKRERVLHQSTESTIQDKAFGRYVTINGRHLINFGSCSYLGLETHPPLVEATVNAARAYGNQFSTSRAYLSHGLYDDLESALECIFEKPVMVSASTTLGHISALPVLVRDEDAVIVDMQVHSSVQTAGQLLKARGIPLTVIRHNDMISLEKQIQQLKSKHERIWYLADGVYSMYGDYADFNGLKKLLDKHKQLHLYFDDAHGASWSGKNGRGIVRTYMEHHDRMVLAVSLNKSFASAGGAIVFANEAQRSLVRNCGGSMIFSGPVQPPLLGAACASVKFHLSAFLEERQSRLQELVRYCDESLAALGIPQYSRNDSPIFFVPVGLPEPTIDLANRIVEDGCYVNVAVYPAIPMRRGGLRFMMTYHLQEEDIDKLVTSIYKHYAPCLAEHGIITAELLSRNFGLADLHLLPGDYIGDRAVTGFIDSTNEASSSLRIELHRSIHDINKDEWDSMFSGKGNIDAESLAALEAVFGPGNANAKPEDQWDFHYFIARDRKDDRVVAATFFTSAMVKDDMMESASTSKKVEDMRKNEDNPYLLTSRTVTIGSLGSVGQLLYLDHSSPYWKDAMKSLASAMEEWQEQVGANQVLWRSLTDEGTINDDTVKEIEELMLELGFSQVQMPENYSVRNMDWTSTEEFLGRMRSKKRNDLRKQVFRHLDKVRIVTDKPCTDEEIRRCYELYEKVQKRAMDFNTFKLPFAFFQEMARVSHAKVVRVYRKANDENEDKLVAMTLNFEEKQKMYSVIIGFDKGAIGPDANLYLLTLCATLMHARDLGCTDCDLGFTSGLSKRKLGAIAQDNLAYIQLKDHFNRVKLSNI